MLVLIAALYCTQSMIKKSSVRHSDVSTRRHKHIHINALLCSVCLSRPFYVEACGSLRFTSTSLSNQLSLQDRTLRHDDSRRRQWERVAAADVKPLRQKNQRFPVCHCGKKQEIDALT